MKKLFFTIVASLLFCSFAQAQDCEAIVAPFLQMKGIKAADYPEGKAKDRCLFSQNSFYLTNEVPQASLVFEFGELTNMLTQQHPENNEVDLNTLSYYLYNFMDFQVRDYHRTIYFHIGNKDYRYLAVRCYDETMDRTYFPEKYIK